MHFMFIHVKENNDCLWSHTLADTVYQLTLDFLVTVNHSYALTHSWVRTHTKQENKKSERALCSTTTPWQKKKKKLSYHLLLNQVFINAIFVFCKVCVCLNDTPLSPSLQTWHTDITFRHLHLGIKSTWSFRHNPQTTGIYGTLAKSSYLHRGFQQREFKYGSTLTICVSVAVTLLTEYFYATSYRHSLANWKNKLMLSPWRLMMSSVPA